MIKYEHMKKFIVGFLSGAVSLTQAASAHANGGYGMMDGWMGGSSFMWLLPLNLLVWLVVGVLLIAYLLKHIK